MIPNVACQFTAGFEAFRTVTVNRAVALIATLPEGAETLRVTGGGGGWGDGFAAPPPVLPPQEISNGTAAMRATPHTRAGKFCLETVKPLRKGDRLLEARNVTVSSVPSAGGN